MKQAFLTGVGIGLGLGVLNIVIGLLMNHFN